MFNTQGLNAGDWLGVFGQDNTNSSKSNPLQTNFQFPSASSSEARNTRNAPANDAFQFPAIGMPRLDRESQFQQELRENQLTSQQAIQNMVAGAAQLSRVTRENYQAKQNLNGGGFSASGGSTGQPSTPSREFSVSSGGGARFTPNAGQVARMQEAMAAGDIARDRENSRSQFNLAMLQNNNDINRMNRQAQIDSASSRISFARQAQEAAKQRVSQERLAQIQANANIYGSMFGALSSPGSNTRYWS